MIVEIYSFLFQMLSQRFGARRLGADCKSCGGEPIGRRRPTNIYIYIYYHFIIYHIYIHIILYDILVKLGSLGFRGFRVSCCGQPLGTS